MATAVAMAMAVTVAVAMAVAVAVAVAMVAMVMAAAAHCAVEDTGPVASLRFSKHKSLPPFLQQTSLHLTPPFCKRLHF